MRQSKKSTMNFLKFAHASIAEAENTWLKELSYSQALVVCVGAGPWKENRRRNVQRRALKRLGDKDLSECILHFPDISFDWYPFEWQNNIVTAVVILMQLTNTTFHDYCEEIIINENTQDFISSLCKSKHSKVLSLFIRDKLELPAFPMDRHVKKRLDDHNLPHDENKIIKLCNKHSIDSNHLNRCIFNAKSKNPTEWK